MSDVTLDPADWDAFRTHAHRALDDALDTLSGVRAGPAWQPVPPAVKRALRADPVPHAGAPAGEVYAQYRRLVAPYAVGNRHPRFFGWIHGSGTPSGMLAELLTASLDVNAGGREHAAPYVERTVIGWFLELFGFPPEASGIVTSGTSMANLIAVLVARQRALGSAVRAAGIAAAGGEICTAYASAEAHGSIVKAFEIAGFGGECVRRIPLDGRHRMDVHALRSAIVSDRARGLRPIFVAGTAGSASVGAVDDLAALADVCASERCWFHVDGAYGALAILSARERALLRGIERADSLAFDFHKWLHVPYDAGCVLIRDGALHRAAFTEAAPYLTRADRGTAGGDPWFCEFGPELSRSFRALKVWLTLKEFGLTRLGDLIERQCGMARDAAALIAGTPPLELLAPVTLNVVCLRFAPPLDERTLDAINARIAVDVQESGIAVPSATRVDGKLGLHLNVMNHRTTPDDVALTLRAIVAAGTAATHAFARTG